MTSHRTPIAASLVALTALVASACGSSTTASGGGATGSNPSIDTFELIASGDSATLLASVNDPDGDVVSAVVDWGDGSIETVSAGFPGVRLTHPYAAPGSYPVSIEATDAAGNGATASGSAVLDAAPDATTTTPPTTAPPSTEPPATEPPTTEPPTTEPPTTEPPTTEPPTTEPPTTEPPSTNPPPPPPPPTTTTPPPPPPPPPEPVTLDLLSSMEWSVSGSAPDGAGGSGEARRVGASGVGIRAAAGHGWNGAGEARSEAKYTFDGTDSLDGHEVARVEVRFRASGNGVLKAPSDRWARVWVDGRSSGAFPEGETDIEFIKEEVSFGNTDNREFLYEFDSGGSHSFLVTADEPNVSFRYQAWCDAESGPKAFALLHEGYCDFNEKGGIQFNSFKITVTPLPNYTVVDGVPTEITG